METSSYSQVVFNDVPPSYPPNTAVTCRYTLTGAVLPDQRDWVGIYKVCKKKQHTLYFLYCITLKKKSIKSVKWARLVGVQHRSIIPTYGWNLPWTMSDLNHLCNKCYSQVRITITAHFRFLFYLSNLSNILLHYLSCVIVPEELENWARLRLTTMSKMLLWCKHGCDMQIFNSLLLETKGTWCVPLRLSCLW